MATALDAALSNRLAHRLGPAEIHADLCERQLLRRGLGLVWGYCSASLVNIWSKSGLPLTISMNSGREYFSCASLDGAPRVRKIFAERKLFGRSERAAKGHAERGVDVT